MISPEPTVKLVIPAGHMQVEVLRLLEESGLGIRTTGKSYRPPASDPRFEIKLLKAANIPKLIEYGAHDVGFSGLDWAQETEVNVETLLDTGLLPVRIVSAAPVGSDPLRAISGRPIVVASEYERLTAQYMSARGVDWRYVRTYGATEVFPPEDADLIVDNTATGSALMANGLVVLDELLRSTTIFMANREAIEDPKRREVIDQLVLLMRSVLDARQRVLLDMNVAQAHLETVVRLLPAMKSPTIQPLYGNEAYAVRAAIPRDKVDALIPMLREAGATDILQTRIQRVIA